VTIVHNSSSGGAILVLMRGPRRTVIGAASLAGAAVVAALAALWLPRPAGPLEPPAQADATGPPAIAVADVQLGRAVRLDKRIASAADAFSPADTIYASVVTEGEADHVRLTARFSREGHVVAEVSQGIAPVGTAVSEFNVRKPRGFAPGAYEVEILVDGVPAGGRPFTVR
jgi:HAMP domain-containing protein